MFGRLLRVCVTALVLVCTACVGLSPGSGSHRNLGELKMELLKYQQSGAYLAEVAKVDEDARAYVLKRVATASKPAIVLDIDETSLSNWPEMAANDFGYISRGSCDSLPTGPCGARAWELSGTAEAIGPTLDLYGAVVNAGIAVFFISGRDESERTATEVNLRAAGFKKWQGLILRPSGSKTVSAADFKAPERAKIEAEGYRIIANIGDQPSDLAGGHAERGFLLPNPFYRIP